MESSISRARALLQSGQEDKAIELLVPAVKENPNNPPLLEVFGEALLEVNDVESAYNVLSQAVTIDPKAEQGVDKFLYLGQIIGGADGVQLLNVAVERLSGQLEKVTSAEGSEDSVLVELAKVYPLEQELTGHLVKKLNRAIFAEIEVWMTDLCMEEEAEKQCDELIGRSLTLDPENPEALSLLASIRISQQRPDEAREAVLKSWDRFSARKAVLDSVADSGDSGDSDSTFEYVELVQPLLALARFAVELEMYDLVPEITGAIADINDNAVDAFYVEALAHLFRAKQLVAGSDSEDYREVDLDVVKKSTNEDVLSALSDARSSLTQGYRAVNSGDAESMDADVAQQIHELVEALGGPNMEELMRVKVSDGELMSD